MQGPTRLAGRAMVSLLLHHWRTLCGFPVKPGVPFECLWDGAIAYKSWKQDSVKVAQVSPMMNFWSFKLKKKNSEVIIFLFFHTQYQTARTGKDKQSTSDQEENNQQTLNTITVTVAPKPFLFQYGQNSSWVCLLQQIIILVK